MSITTSNKVADNVVDGLLAVIAAEGTAFPFPAFGNRSTRPESKSNVEVRAGNFTRGSDQMAQLPNTTGQSPSHWYYPHRRGWVSFTVKSQRHSLTENAPDNKHSECVGLCRDLMDITKQKLQPSLFQGYQFVDVIDQGDTWAMGDTTRQDSTEIRFQVDIWIPPSGYTAT